MRDDEGCNGVLMVLLMNRRGDYERMEGLKIQIGQKRCAITQLDMVRPRTCVAVHSAIFRVCPSVVP